MGGPMKRLLPLFCALVFILTSCFHLRPADGTYTPPVETKAPVNTPVVVDPKPEETDEPFEPVGTSFASGEVLEPDGIIEGNEPIDPFAGVSIDFLAVGDNLIHANIWLDAAARAPEGVEFDFLPMYEHIAPYVEEADVAFINQETVMAGAQYGYTAYPTFNSPQQLGLDLVTLGFDIINVASNHTLDKGESGYRSMLDFWHTQPVTMIGGYYNKEDYENIRVTEVDGVKIAWLSYTYGTNGISLPANSTMFVPYYNDDQLIVDAIAKAEEIADVTIVSMHFGWEEYNPVPMTESVRLAQLIADNGAEVILGHHSHCLQPIDWIEGKDGNKTLCIYSMGNIACGQARQITMVGGMFTFTIESDGNGGLRVVDPLLTPTVNYYDWNWMNTKIYLLDQYTEEIAATHGLGNPSINGGGLSPDEAKKIVKNAIDPQFLPGYLQ